MWNVGMIHCNMHTSGQWACDSTSSIPRACSGLTTYKLFVLEPFTMHFFFSSHFASMANAEYIESIHHNSCTSTHQMHDKWHKHNIEENHPWHLKTAFAPSLMNIGETRRFKKYEWFPWILGWHKIDFGGVHLRSLTWRKNQTYHKRTIRK